MKKIIITIAILAFASSAFATDSLYGAGETPPAGITFMPSKNVKLAFSSGPITAGDNVVYSIASKNTAGDRIFGATSASSAVAQSVSTAGTTLAASHLPTKPTTASDSTIAGGADNWSIL